MKERIVFELSTCDKEISIGHHEVLLS
jgi:hypothetical protein